MRKDGRKIKTAEPMYKVAMHIMVERNDAMNMIELTVKQDPVRKYIRKMKDEGYTFSHLAIVLAGFIRTVSEFPFLNRFIVNRQLYARNELAIGMVVLKPGETEGTMNKMYFNPANTIFEVQKILDEYINTNRQTGETNPTDKIIGRLLSIPGLCKISIGFLKWLDKHGWLPKSIIEASPFHCTMTITNLASIGTNYVFHHVYNFGTTSMVMAMGNPREEAVARHGQIELEKIIPIGFVMDERIASGVEFAMACRRMQYFLENPVLLEQPPESIVQDIK